MVSTSESQNQIVRYLLDEMDSRERSQIDERLTRDPSFFEELSATEDDLIMKYLSGNLGNEVLRRFKQVYMESPARRTRVEAACFLRDAVRQTAGLKKSAPSKAAGLRLLVASAAVAALILVLLLVSTKRPGHAPSDLEHVASLSFSLGGVSRSGDGLQIAIPVKAREIELRLLATGVVENGRYQAVIRDPKQVEVWKGGAFLKDGQAVVTVPTEVLQDGDYTLELQTNLSTAGNAVEIYYFRVLIQKP